MKGQLWQARSDDTIPNLLLFFCPEAFCGGPVLRFMDFTVLVTTASTSNPWMVTNPSANHGPSCLTSVFLWELVNPTWYCLSLQLVACIHKNVSIFLINQTHLYSHDQYHDVICNLFPFWTDYIKTTELDLTIVS